MMTGTTLGAGEPGVSDTATAAAARKAVYEQDAQFARYRDGLKWSRFQTASAIDAAALYGAFQLAGLRPIERGALVVFATILIVLVFLQAVLDEREAKSHLQRMTDFEKDAGCPYPHPERRPLRLKTSRIVMATIVAFNVVVAAKVAQIIPGL